MAKRITPTLRGSILQLLIGKAESRVTFKDIADSHNVSISTVRRIHEQFLEECDAVLAECESARRQPGEESRGSGVRPPNRKGTG